MEIARRVAQHGHYVEFICIGEHRMYRPEFSVIDTATGKPASTTAAPTHAITRIEAPYRTFLNDKQEGWSVFDNSFRVGRAAGSRWDLVYGFSHKPDCVLPALVAKLRGAKIVLDWSDWWGTSEGLFEACVVPSDYFQALPKPLRLIRRTVFAAEGAWEPKVYGLADAVTLIGEDYLAHPRAPKSLASKSLVMHSGSPLREITPLPKDECRARLGLTIPPDAFVFGYMANFHTGERLMLEAFARVCAERNDAWMLVVGSDFEKSDPALHEAIKHRVIHAGRQPFERVGLYLGASDALLLPLNDVALDRARYPHKFSDYVAAGRPIIACNVGETGRLMARYSIPGALTTATAEGFATGMLQVMNSGNLETEGREVRRIAEEHFDWDVMCGRLFEFIETQTGVALQ